MNAFSKIAAAFATLAFLAFAGSPALAQNIQLRECANGCRTIMGNIDDVIETRRRLDGGSKPSFHQAPVPKHYESVQPTSSWTRTHTATRVPSTGHVSKDYTPSSYAPIPRHCAGGFTPLGATDGTCVTATGKGRFSMRDNAGLHRDLRCERVSMTSRPGWSADQLCFFCTDGRDGAKRTVVTRGAKITGYWFGHALPPM